MATSLLPQGFDEPEAPVPPVPRARDTDAGSAATRPAAGQPAAVPKPDPAAPDQLASSTTGWLLRYAPGMSLRDLSARTRLPQDELAALDRGDTSHCGGDFYLRAHLTCIAAALQIEPDVLLLSFDRRPAVRMPDGTLGMRAPVRHRRRATGKHVARLLVILLVLGGLGALVYKVANRSTTPAAAGKHVTTGTSSTAARHPAPRHAVVPPPAVPAGTVAVALAVNGQPTWLLAQDQNGTTLFEGTVPAGTVQMLRGTSVHTVVGNAGAVTPTCNYHRGTVMGAPGQVVTMDFAPGAAGC